jgi:hypothetical protein
VRDEVGKLQGWNTLLCGSLRQDGKAAVGAGHRILLPSPMKQVIGKSVVSKVALTPTG